MKNLALIFLLLSSIVLGILYYQSRMRERESVKRIKIVEERSNKILSEIETSILVAPILDNVSIGDTLSLLVTPILKRSHDSLYWFGTDHPSQIGHSYKFRPNYAIFSFGTDSLPWVSDSSGYYGLSVMGSISDIHGKQAEPKRRIYIKKENGKVRWVLD